MDKLKKQNSLISHSTREHPKIVSFQKTFSNINGKTNSSSKKIISDGNTGKMYLNQNGNVSSSDLNYHQLKKEFNLPFLKFNSAKIFSQYPLLLNEYNNYKPELRRRPTFLVRKFNWNTFLLLLIFFLLIFISIKLLSLK